MRRLSSDEPIRTTPSANARGTAIRPPVEGPPRHSPSAWDDLPTDGGLVPAAEPAPDLLHEWYRYVDSLARPTRRPDEEETEPEDALTATEDETEGDSTHPHRVARPWSEDWSPPQEAGVDPAMAKEIVEQLAPSPAPTPRVEWQPSLTEVAVPELAQFIRPREAREITPAGEDVIARLLPSGPAPVAPLPPERTRAVPTDVPRAPAPSGSPDAEPARPARADSDPVTDGMALVPVPGSDRTESPFTANRGRKQEEPVPAARDLPGIPEIREQWPQYAERLRQVPASEVAQNSYKTPFKETRADLIGRLLDPPLTLEETARLIGVCPTTVRRYTNRGWLSHYRTPGNQRRFRLSAVLTFLEEHGETTLLDQA